MSDPEIYYATKSSRIPVGPYRPDEFRAQLAIRQSLGYGGEVVYRIEARDIRDAIAKMRGAIK